MDVRYHIPSAALAATLLLLLTALPCFEASAQWIQQNSGTTVTLNDVAVLDSLRAVVVGDFGIILRTTNAGLTWTRVDSTGYRWNAVACRNATDGIAVGDEHSGAITTDGGLSWSRWHEGGMRKYLSASYLTQNQVLIGDDTGAVRFSSDGGATWGSYGSAGSAVVDLIFARLSDTTYRGYIVVPWWAAETNNSGITWTWQHLPLTIWGRAIHGGTSPDGSVAFVVAVDGNPGPFPKIFRKTLSDSTWESSPSFPLFRVPNDVSVPSGQIAYACGSGGTIYKTTDAGVSWTIMDSVTSHYLNGIAFYDVNRGYAVGTNGTILHTSNGGITGVEEANSKPQGFQLFQNYPNPFNPATTIRFQTANYGFVSLKVFDVLGREVAVLVNKDLPPGDHQVEWRGEGFASGVYFYRLVAGSPTVTRKAILLR